MPAINFFLLSEDFGTLHHSVSSFISGVIFYNLYTQKCYSGEQCCKMTHNNFYCRIHCVVFGYERDYLIVTGATGTLKKYLQQIYKHTDKDFVMLYVMLTKIYFIINCFHI